jgi:hypothetical protein
VKNTALGATHGSGLLLSRNGGFHEKRDTFMLKIRLQGTEKEIEWFKKILIHIPQLKVREFSELFPNKGTKKYFRVYSEIDREDDEEV